MNRRQSALTISVILDGRLPAAGSRRGCDRVSNYTSCIGSNELGAFGPASIDATLMPLLKEVSVS